MFEKITNFFKGLKQKEKVEGNMVSSKNTAKERLHLVLMQDRANVSADFLDLMKQEIIEVIKKYIDIDESAMDVRLTNKENNDGTNGAPALYANIPIMNIKDEVSFFQAVKARLCKFDSTSSEKTNEEIETTIRQVVDKALVSEQVVDIFDAAGIKKPDISILSEEFLMELRGMEHKNIALEVLRKLLNDEISVRMHRNLVQGRTLMEMLEHSITKYHNKVITAVEVIDELIGLSKHIIAQDDAAKTLGLSE